MDIKSTLIDMGLAENQAMIYLVLLRIGSATAGEIAKKSGVNRTNVYDALDRLIEKGLVSYVIRANRKHFESKTPEALKAFLEQEEDKLKQKKEQLDYLFPKLESIRKLNYEKQEATIYKGKKGLKSIAEDVIKEKREIFVFGAEGSFVEIFSHYASQWHLKRKLNNVKIRILFNERTRKEKSKSDFPLSQMRFTDQIEDTPATTWIYGDKVAIIVWSEQPIATLIRSKEVAKSYKQFFDVLWKTAKQ